MKKALQILVFCACLIGVARFTHHQTHGFRLSKITGNLCEESTWLAPAPSPLFDERYHYLGRGLQSFVFASEDGNTVIKIFNNRYQHRLKLYRLLSKLPFAKHWAEERYDYFHSKLLRTFSSYRIAHQEMHAEAGLIYTHLDPSTDLPSRLIIVDALNIEHAIDPNHCGFIIQKRAKLVYPTLLDYIRTGKIDEAKSAIASLIDLFVLKYQKGIADNDPLIRTNYGFLDGQPIQIDVGPFSKDLQIADPEVYRQEITKTTRSLKNWLNTHSPELVSFVDESIDLSIKMEEK